MLRYKKFLESIDKEDNFEELKTIIKNIIDHINLINEVIVKWQDEFEFSYEFNNELWFYGPMRVARIFGLRRHHSHEQEYYIYIHDNDGKICLDKRYDDAPLDIIISMKKPVPIINFMVYIDSSVDGIPVNNIIKEIKNRYPFVRIDKVGSPSNCEMQFEININDINDAI